MYITKVVVLLFLFSLPLCFEQTSLNGAESQLNQIQENVQPNYSKLFDQQCPIQMTSTQGNLDVSPSLFSNIWSLLHCFYLIYSVTSTILIHREYQNGYFCFIFTFVSLIKHIHAGLHFMHYCKLIEGNPTKGNVFFATIVFVNLWKIISMVFSGRLTRKQRIHAAIYFTFLMITGFWFKSLCEMGIQCISFAIHYYQLDYDHKTPRYVRLPSIFFANLGFTMINYGLISVFYSQLLLAELSSFQQRILSYALFIGMFTNTLKVEYRIKSLWRWIIRMYHIVILKHFGYKLETETCRICWQQMDVFAGVNEIQDLDGAYTNGLIRVHLNHIFHAKCLAKWTQTRNTCPVDGMQIKS